MTLWIKVLIAMVSGFLIGLLMGPYAIFLQPLGQLFLNLINMVVVLLIFSSMTVAVTSIHDPKKLERVGLKTLGLYLMTTLIAILLGLAGGLLFEPAASLKSMLSTATIEIPKNPPSFVEILFGIIPKNPIAALAEGNVLQVMVFAVFLGITINLSGKKGQALRECLESLTDVMYRMTSLIMEFSPYGIFALMAGMTGSFGFSVLIPLAKFLALYYGVCLLHILIVFCGGLRFFAKLKVWPFFQGMGDAIFVAFSTCSSSATLPISMHCVQENLGVSKNIANFVLPLGSTINMNGAAIFQAMAALFIAQAYGIELSWGSLAILILTATLSAIGAAGVPGTGFIALALVLRALGLPLEGMALLAGIDRLREMISTVLNVLGDALVAVYIAKVEGELDEKQYYHEVLVEMTEDEGD